MFMKINKTLIIVPIIMILVISLSGCITDSIFKTGETYAQNGITFQYPEDWHVVNSVAEGSVAAVASKNNPKISTVIQQVPTELGTDIQTACSNNNKNLVLSPNYINLQEVQSTVNGQTVILHRYLVNEDDGSQKEHVATWIQMSNGQLYVLLFNTPLEEYDTQRYAYDMIVGSFALENQSNGNSDSFLDSVFDRINMFFST